MMSKTIQATAEILKSVCDNVFCGKSAVIYPKINFDLGQISDSDFKTRYRLTIDVYVNTGIPNDAVALGERAAAALLYTQFKDNEGGVIVFGRGTGGQLVPAEKDEKIIHYTRDFTVDYYKNRDI